MSIIVPCIVVDNRICKINSCQANSKTKKMFIKCEDIETLKPYALFITNSPYKHKHSSDGTFLTEINLNLPHLLNYNYSFRKQSQEDLLDTENEDNVTMFTAGKENVIICCCVVTTNGIFRIINFFVDGNKLLLKTEQLFTKEKVDHVLISETIIHKNKNYITAGFAIVRESENMKALLVNDKDKNIVEFIY